MIIFIGLREKEDVSVATDFSRGPVWKNIIMQAVPLTIAQLVQVLYNIVDRIYIGHLPESSSLALTGIGLTFPIVALVAAFTALFGPGGAPLFSIERGAGHEDKAQNIMCHSCFLLIVSGILLTVVTLVFKVDILFLFGASQDTIGYADEYLRIYLFGTIFTMFSTGMNSFISAQGFAKTGMYTVIIGAITNIILDPIFIFVLNLGVSGAAIATVIAQCISAFWVFSFLRGKKAILRLQFKDFKPEGKIIKNITSLGMAGFFMSASNATVQIVCNKTLNIYGGDLYIGIMTVLNSVREIFQLATNGIMHGAQPVLGFDYGAKRYDRVRQGIKFASILACVYTLVVWGIIELWPDFFIRIFNNDPDIILYGARALKIYFFGFVFMALQFSGQSTFVALGKSKQSIFFSLFRKVIIVVPLTILLPQVAGLGVWGVFWAEPISNIIGGTASFTTMMLTVWRKLNVQTD